MRTIKKFAACKDNENLKKNIIMIYENAEVVIPSE